MTNKIPKTISYKRFAAIDFETADYGRDSACAVAVVIVENQKIINKIFSLIKPPRKNFIFTYIHGITWQDVAGKPTFGEFWPEIALLLDGIDFIAAHNASFERGVIQTSCEMIGQAILQKKYLCTMKLARHLWNIRPTKLSDVCSHFGIALEHHEAQSDALACAEIVLRANPAAIPVSAFLG